MNISIFVYSHLCERMRKVEDVSEFIYWKSTFSFMLTEDETKPLKKNYREPDTCLSIQIFCRNPTNFYSFVCFVVSSYQYLLFMTILIYIYIYTYRIFLLLFITNNFVDYLMIGVFLLPIN